MADIQINFAEAEARARALAQRDEAIRSDLLTLKGEIDQFLQTDFKTQKSSIAFGERFEEFKTQADAVIATLTEMGNQLNSIMAGFQQADASL
ncbi:MAG TPA: WXG100 family type VII secretion target, partial [Dermatophilaceae bacterium]|nr:WXG100 family type VII secretion target [Dermatophilaceae bacterium]